MENKENKILLEGIWNLYADSKNYTWRINYEPIETMEEKNDSWRKYLHIGK